MFPATLDPDSVESRAEIKLYKALRDQLDDSWDVYHSTSWTQRHPAKGSFDGEIDFMLAHPEKGILCVEAKSGGIRVNDGEWVRLANGKEVPYEKDPFEQAVGHKYALINAIKKMPSWGDERLLIGHAVALPEIAVNASRMPPNAPPQLTIDRRDMTSIGKAIDRALAYHDGSDGRGAPPGDRGMRMLRKLLVPSIEIRVPLAETFLEEEEHLVRLTFEQATLLHRFGNNRRMKVCGCAGSGKTVLAVEHAKWLHRNKGLDVGFVCFNAPLAEHLKKREFDSGVDFVTFHGLCTRLGHQAPGVEVLGYPMGEAPQEFFDEQLPEALIDAAIELGGIYDALIIDEAQDLHDHWLAALMATLRDEEQASIWLFMDDNQRIFGADLDVPHDFLRYDLGVNCRNTQAIHREVIKLYDGRVVPEASGLEGRPIELIQTDDQPAAVAAVIRGLCGEEDVPPQDVVVLSAHAKGKSIVGSSKPAPYTFVKERGAMGKKIFFSSIRRFKGLEAKVVILCELEDLDDETRDQQVYVGMSRAVNHCVVVEPNPAPSIP